MSPFSPLRPTPPPTDARTAHRDQGGRRTVTASRRTIDAESSSYRIASLTKPFTSAATILALAERAIPLSIPAITLLPSLISDWNADRSITVEQLLGQVAGLRASVDGAAVAALGDGHTGDDLVKGLDAFAA